MLDCLETLRAVQFAEQAHRYQKRKYLTDVPYAVHCFAVAEKVASCSLPLHLSPHRLSLVQTALLHDTLEDCPEVSYDEIKAQFGEGVALMVKALTDAPAVPEGPNRAARKEMTRSRFAVCGDGPRVVKCADILDNLKSILVYDPDFGKLFLREVEDLLPVLKPSMGECSLYSELYDNVHANKGTP